ncbi:MAG: protein-arginine deiminase family protein [Sedimentisphaerales bacterium]|nr:protein-arginine deiminase family protein [Sedimentisphaerales bacterium]
MPALFYLVTDLYWEGYDNRAFGWMPNMVNHLNAVGVRAVPKPFALNGISPDPFESSVRNVYGGTVVFIDEYYEYHLDGGEIHCGTAVKRSPSTWKWWQ